MDKLKAVFSPGSKADDEVMYGEGDSSNMGKMTGQGTHFGHSRTTDPSEDVTAPQGGLEGSEITNIRLASTTAIKGGVPGSTQDASDKTPSSDATKAAKLATIFSASGNTSSTGEKNPESQTAELASSRAGQTHQAPSTNDPQSQVSATSARTDDPRTTIAGIAASRAEKGHQDQLAPDARSSSVANQGNAGLPIYDEMTGQPSQKAPASSTAHPHSQSGAAAATSGELTSSTSPYNSHSVDPRVDGSKNQSTHYGRDAALGGGAAAAAAAAATAYEADKSRREPQHENVRTIPGSFPEDESTAPKALEPQPQQPSATNEARRTPTEAPPAPGGTTQSDFDSKTGKATYTVGDSAGQSKQAEPEHHYGRDALLGTGTAAAGIGALKKEEDHNNKVQPAATETTAQPATTETPAQPAATEATAQPSTQTTTDPKSSTNPLGSLRDLIMEKTGFGASKSEATEEPAAKDIPTEKPRGESAVAAEAGAPKEEAEQHHYGRDAALGAGAGAVGIAGYEVAKHREPESRPEVTGAAPTGYDAQRVPGTTANEPWSTVPTSNLTAQQPHPSTTHSTQQTTSQQEPKEHHYGRDAALGAGAGTAGVAGYEALKDHHNHPSQPNTVEGAKPSTQAPSTVVSEPAETKAQEVKPDEHHYGRDAAVGAGVAGAGAAAYEAKKHEDEKRALEEQKEREKQLAAQQKEAEKEHEKEIKQQEKEQKKAEKEHEKAIAAEEKAQAKEEKKVEKEHEKAIAAEEKAQAKEQKKAEKEYEKQLQKEEKEHAKEVKAAEKEEEKRAKEEEKAAEEERKRREKEAAAVAGAAGAAGIAEHEHEKHKDEDKDVEGHEGEEGKKKKSGLLGLFSRNKDKSADDEEESKQDKHEKEAIAGTGIVGAAAVGKHEYDEHKDKDKDTVEGEEEDGKKKKGGLLGLLSRNKDKTDDEDKELKHDKREKEAVEGAGLVGAGALGKHEYDQHKDQQVVPQAATEPTVQPPESGEKIYKDSLGHYHREKTVPEDPATGSDSHRKEELAAGAGVVGAGAVGKHEYDRSHEQSVNTGYPQEAAIEPSSRTAQGSSVYSTQAAEGSSGFPVLKSEEPTATHQHHKEEAAIAGAGTLGAGALGKYEYDTRHPEGPTTAITPGQVQDTSYTAPKSHHKEEAVAGAGVLGAGAIGKHEYDTHHEATTATSGQPERALGESSGYAHPKTESDVAAEKRNDIPVVGELHREGRFHGKEGGAPGAVGVAPSERDTAYAESQRQTSEQHDGEHKKHGILGGIFHRNKDEKENESLTGQSDRHRLHKDPPADHPAAQSATADSGHGGEGLLHGHHSSNLPDTADVNVESKLHDPANMGYKGTGSYDL